MNTPCTCVQYMHHAHDILHLHIQHVSYMYRHAYQFIQYPSKITRINELWQSFGKA